ncbi:peroxiredoxin family protein [Simiduia curdlanivorans]|uniref:thioredoxin-dependent peroxiredoxin n=1 Tax=Simiduia curdlanivorans TaxID=1492769 RepID=A0ABV8V6M0_9GAMM|nr:peroxiredoxin family protein [Simiduia curdlanivorans]MDN3638912.1 peroxiredoxin family protein [Simiduia curdlanivorans]
MRLITPHQGLNFATKDIYGKPFSLKSFRGKRVMLSFFRDAACPFCHLRVYELSQNYQHWQDQNLEVIAVFSDTPAQVRRFVANHPRPFTMLADPKLALYNHYGVEQSGTALLKALVLKLPRIIRGFMLGAKPSNNPHVKLVPADFLIDEDGAIQQAWYGRDTSDHIPLAQVQAFIDTASRTSSHTPKFA